MRALRRLPFGICFANANTLYVADEGNGTIGTVDTTNAYDDALVQNGNTGGLEKWVFNGTSWNLAYTLTNGLGLGVPYTVASYPTGVNSVNGNTNFPSGLPWAPAPDGLRNITGRVNTDGTVNIWAITSTISGNGDQGADPNQLVFVTDQLADTSNTPPASAQFAVLETAGFGEVLRGVAFAPGAIASAPSSGNACNGVYNGTFQGNLTISAGQNCVFVGGAINGNVQLDGGNLSLTNTVVNGNVQLQGGGSFSIGPSVTINGNLQAHNLPAGGAGNQVCDSKHNGQPAISEQWNAGRDRIRFANVYGKHHRRQRAVSQQQRAGTDLEQHDQRQPAMPERHPRGVGDRRQQHRRWTKTRRVRRAIIAELRDKCGRPLGNPGGRFDLQRGVACGQSSSCMGSHPQASSYCAYSKPKPGRIDDGARQGLVSWRCGRSSGSAENLAHLSPMRDGSGPHCNMKRKLSGQRSSALRRTR